MKGGDKVNLKTIRETAEIFGVCEETVRRWIKSKKIKSVSVGGRFIRISEDEIERIKRGE